MAARKRLAQIGAVRRNRRAMDGFREAMRARRGSPRAAFRRPVAPGMGLHRGWQGLDQAFADLQEGDFTQQQIDRMLAGRTPGGEHGHFMGIGPQAMKILGQLMQKDEPDLIGTEGLEGDELFRANMQNMVAQMQPANFDLNSAAAGEGGGLDWIQQLLGGLEGQVLPEPGQRFVDREWPPRGLRKPFPGRGHAYGRMRPRGAIRRALPGRGPLPPHRFF